MSHTLRLLWPVVDDSLTYEEAVAEAAPQVAWMAHQRHAEVVGPLTWRLDESELWPGYEPYTTVLVCEAPAVPVEHGTPEGWRWHNMAGQDPCTSCADWQFSNLISSGVGGVAGGDEVGRE